VVSLGRGRRGRRADGAAALGMVGEEHRGASADDAERDAWRRRMMEVVLARDAGSPLHHARRMLCLHQVHRT